MSVKLMYVAVAAAIVLFAIAGLAQNRGFAPASPLLASVDADSDGVVTADEIRNSPAAIRKLDANKDGRLSEAEFRPAMGSGRRGGREGTGGNAGGLSEEMLTTLMAFDKDGDGKLARSEVPERLAGLFDRGDADKDGALSAGELKAMTEVAAPAGSSGGRGGRGRGGEGGRRPNDPLATALDADRDGEISVAEVENAPAALRTLDRNQDASLTREELGEGRGRGFFPRR